MHMSSDVDVSVADPTAWAFKSRVAENHHPMLVTVPIHGRCCLVNKYHYGKPCCRVILKGVSGSQHVALWASFLFNPSTQFSVPCSRVTSRPLRSRGCISIGHPHSGHVRFGSVPFNYSSVHLNIWIHLYKWKHELLGRQSILVNMYLFSFPALLSPNTFCKDTEIIPLRVML